MPFLGGDYNFSSFQNVRFHELYAGLTVDPSHSSLVETAMRERTGSGIDHGNEKNLAKVQETGKHK